MRQEDKELLLRDLSARLSYGVKCQLNTNRKIPPLTLVKISKTGGCSLTASDITVITHDRTIEEIKPYLRPISSMTEEERKEHRNTMSVVNESFYVESLETFDFYNKRHIDYRNLIRKGLALEAEEGMYKFE